MKGLSSLERSVLESVGKTARTYEELFHDTGLHENVLFNILQALIIRGVLATDGARYSLNPKMSDFMKAEYESIEHRNAEALELVEEVINSPGHTFKLMKVSMDTRDYKIYQAMLSNLESFLLDADKKGKALAIPSKERKVIFWGHSDIQSLINNIIRG